MLVIFEHSILKVIDNKQIIVINDAAFVKFRHYYYCMSFSQILKLIYLIDYLPVKRVK